MGRLRLLVVDDDTGIREGFRILLEREGHDVKAAGDAGTAVRWIKRTPIDCMLIDLDLTRDPELGINGLDIIALLRIHQPAAKAILMSASTDAALTRLAHERGAAARLEKPVDLAALRRLLKELSPTDGPPAPRSPALRPIV